MPPSNIISIHIVLLKLQRLHDNGETFFDYRWLFDWGDNLSINDNIERATNEHKALETLSQAGVIKARIEDNWYRNQQLEAEQDPARDFKTRGLVVWSDWSETDPAHREYDYLIYVDGFNHDKFAEACRFYKFSPETGTIEATLEIRYGTPIVSAQGNSYHLPPLKDGVATWHIINEASKHYNEEVSLGDIERAIGRKLTKPNLTQILIKNPFGKSNYLGMFTDLRPKSIKLHTRANITQEQLLVIEKLAQK